jgi:hypothetical protein
MLRFELPVVLVGLAILAALVAINVLWFSALDANYFEWYLSAGFAVALLFGVVVVAIDLDRSPGLIAAHPFFFLRETTLLLAKLSGTLAQQILTRFRRPDRDLSEAGLSLVQSRYRWPAFDRALALPFAFIVMVAMLAWTLVIAPLQYWVNLFCGAPGALRWPHRKRWS